MKNKQIEFKMNEPLKNYSTIKIGGNVKYLAIPSFFGDCLDVFDFVTNKKLDFYILGNGSNTLCSSYGFNGLVMVTKNLQQFNILNMNLKKTNKKVSLFVDKKGTSNLSLFYRKKINTNNCNSIIKTKFICIRAFCGILLPKLSNIFSNKGYIGLEFACGIPATVGGAVVMNAGAYNGQMSDVVYRVLVYNYKTKQLYYKYNDKMVLYNFCERIFKYRQNNKYYLKTNFKILYKSNYKVYKAIIKKNIYNYKMFLKFDYRQSNINRNEFIICVDLVLKSGNVKKILENVDRIMKQRITSQNVGYPSLGSVFKRQGNIMPAKIIEKLGLKGLRLGGAMISPKHSGFIVNVDNATSFDYYNLLKKVQYIVCKNHNIMLQYEVKFLGDYDEKK